MPKRFSKSGASSCVATCANVAQASSLHTALSSKCGVGAGCASPDFAGPRQTATTHLPANSANPFTEKTGGIPPPKPKRRLLPPHSTSIPSDRGTLEISGANLMYEGARVKSWMLGRDVNPAGRGDGAYYAQGAFSIGSVRPSPTTTPVGGWGNSVNNESESVAGNLQFQGRCLTDSQCPCGFQCRGTICCAYLQNTIDLENRCPEPAIAYVPPSMQAPLYSEEKHNLVSQDKKPQYSGGYSPADPPSGTKPIYPEPGYKGPIDLGCGKIGEMISKAITLLREILRPETEGGCLRYPNTYLSKCLQALAQDGGQRLKIICCKKNWLGEFINHAELCGHCYGKNVMASVGNSTAQSCILRLCIDNLHTWVKGKGGKLNYLDLAYELLHELHHCCHNPASYRTWLDTRDNPGGDQPPHHSCPEWFKGKGQPGNEGVINNPNKETYAVLCTNACFPKSRMWDYDPKTAYYVPHKCACCG